MGISGGMFLQEGRMERRVCSLKDGKGEFSFVTQNVEIWARGSSALVECWPRTHEVLDAATSTARTGYGSAHLSPRTQEVEAGDQKSSVIPVSEKI